jgi:ABC-type sugar transport system permease subunit
MRGGIVMKYVEKGTYSIKRKLNLGAYIFLLPFLLFLCFFLVYPFGWLIVVSLFNGTIFSPMNKFVGLRNYVTVMKEPFFQTALFNTLSYGLIIVIVSVPLSLLFAMLSLMVRKNSFFTLALILPFFVPIVVGGFIWRWMVHYDYGPINNFLYSIGIARIQWLDNQHALPTIAMMQIWRIAGYNTLVIMSGISAIPQEYFDAASVDGAGSWRRFFRITLPLLRPMITFIVIMNLIWSFQIFDSVWIMTGGGPGHASASLCYYVFTKAFEFYELEKAVVGGFFLMVMVFIVAFIMMRLLKSEFEY